MTKSTRVFGDRVLRSGKRFFSTRYKDEVKRVRITPLTVVNTQENEIKVLDYESCKKMEIDDDQEQKEIKLGKSKKTKFEELMEFRLIDDNRINRFGAVYTRKRKRNVLTDSSLVCKKKARTCLESRFDRKGHAIFSCRSDDSSSSGSIYRFSCFVRLVLKYLRNATLFSWKQFSSFLLSDPTAASVYSLIGIWSLQDCGTSTSHGSFKVFGSVNSIPFFTVNIISLPFCILYMHSTFLLKFAFLSYSFITHQIDHNVTNDVVKRSSVTKKPRSARKRIPRAVFFDKYFQKNGWAHVVTLVPSVREISGYTEEKYVPFKLPEFYISSKSDEVTRSLEKSYPIYDMDSDDELWLKKLNNERFQDNGCVSEETFEKVIDAFERGIYCTPNDYSNAESVVEWCGKLASTEVLKAVYRYWMTKRKKKRSPLVTVFQMYRQKRVNWQSKTTVLPKKRSFKRRASQRFVEKKLNLKKAMLYDQKILENAAKASIKVHETQEAAKRSEEAAIVKRQQAQQLMVNADLATYRATIALKIAAAARVTAGLVAITTGSTSSCYELPCDLVWCKL